MEDHREGRLNAGDRREDPLSKEDRWREAIRRGAEATRCRDFLLSLLESRRRSLVSELETYEADPNLAAAMAARLQELRFIEATVENMIHTAKLCEEELRNE